MPPVRIAIDGPGSSGKGTVARMLARELGYPYVDTGAMYRAVALACLRRDVPLTDGAATGAVARGLVLHFSWDADGLLRLSMDGEDVTTEIRQDHVGRGASDVAVHPEVRSALLDQQRELAARGGVVMDGRDIGTVVLPNAELKVFLDADLDERARRRHAELVERGGDESFDEVRARLAARDAQDRERDTAPLRAADDAVVLDSTRLSPAEVVTHLAALARTRGAA